MKFISGKPPKLEVGMIIKTNDWIYLVGDLILEGSDVEGLRNLGMLEEADTVHLNHVIAWHPGLSKFMRDKGTKL